MAHPIHCKNVAGITELKRDPVKTVESAAGHAVAILHRNEPVFYCVPIDLFEGLMRASEQRSEGLKNQANV